MSVQEQFAPGTQVGSYQIVRLLGQGGMGEVYLAEDPRLDRRVALKFLRPEALRDPDIVARLQTEGKVLAKLQHPAILTVYGMDDFKGLPYLIMEHVEGTSLSRYLAHGLLGLSETLDVFRRVAEGMEEVHRHGVVHRDLKPGNIIVGSGGAPKVIDFGIAKSYGWAAGHETTAGVVLGTLNYLAPEIARGLPPTQQTDIYSLGLILFEMLTGFCPFVGRNNLETLERIKTEPLVFPESLKAWLPAGLYDLVTDMTAKRPDDRPPSLRKVLERLETVDLNALPADLLVSPVQGVEVQNLDEIREELKRKGFEPREMSFIVNLAILAQKRSQSAPSPDATIRLGATEKLVLTPWALSEAVRRLSEAKSEASSLGVSGKTVVKSERPPVQEARRSPGLVAAATAALVVSTAIGFFFLAPRGPAVSRQVASLDREPAPESAAPQAVSGPSDFEEKRPVSTPEPPRQEPVEVKRENPPRVEAPPAEAPRVSDPPAANVKPPVFTKESIAKIAQDSPIAGDPIPAPQYRVGDEWTYLRYGANGKAELVTLKIAEIREHSIVYENQEGKKSEGPLNPFVGLTSFENSLQGTGHQTLEGDLEDFFPLKLLKSFIVKTEGTSDEMPGGWKRELTCTAFVNKQVTSFQAPAGKFKVTPVICKDEQQGDYAETFYYVPEVKRFVLWVVSGLRPWLLNSYKVSP